MSENKQVGIPDFNDAAGGKNPRSKKSEKQQADVDTWRAALSGQILAQSGSSSSSMGDTWLNGLKHDSQQFLEHQSGGRLDKIRQEQLVKQAVEVTVDRLFSCLQGYAYEFNKVSVGTDLHVSGTMSGDVKEVLNFNKFREAEKTQTFFRARVSTRLYSLVIRGSEKLIDCFIMPVNHAMALSKLEGEYNPLATIEIKVNEDDIVWRSVSDDCSFDSLEDLCAWLFKELVEQTRRAIAVRNRGDN